MLAAEIASMAKGTMPSVAAASPTEYVTFSPSVHFEPHVVRDSRSATMRRRLVVAAGLLMAAALVMAAAGTSDGWGDKGSRRVDMVAWSNEYDDGRGVLHGYQHGVTRVISNICDPDDPSCKFHDSPIGYMAAVWSGKTKESNELHPRYVQVRKDGLLPSSYEDQIGDGVASSIAHSGDDGQFHSRIHPAPQYHLVRLPEQQPRTYKHTFYNLGAVQDVDYEEEPEVRAENQETVAGQPSGYHLKNADDRWRDQAVARTRYPARSAPIRYPENGGEEGGVVHYAYGTAPKESFAAPPEEEEERADLMNQLRTASQAVAQEGERYSQVAGRLAAVRSEGASLSHQAEEARAMLLKWSAEEKKIAEKMGEKGEEGCACGGCACGELPAAEAGEARGEEEPAEGGAEEVPVAAEEEGAKEEGGEGAQPEEVEERVEKEEPVGEEERVEPAAAEKPSPEEAREEEGGAAEEPEGVEEGEKREEEGGAAEEPEGVEEGEKRAVEEEGEARPEEEREAVEEPVAEEGGGEAAPAEGGEEPAGEAAAEERGQEAPAAGGEPVGEEERVEPAPAEEASPEGGEEEAPAEGGEKVAAAEGGEEAAPAEEGEAAEGEQASTGEPAPAEEEGAGGAPDGSTAEPAAKGVGADAPAPAPAA